MRILLEARKYRLISGGDLLHLPLTGAQVAELAERFFNVAANEILKLFAGSLRGQALALDLTAKPAHDPFSYRYACSIAAICIRRHALVIGHKQAAK